MKNSHRNIYIKLLTISTSIIAIFIISQLFVNSTSENKYIKHKNNPYSIHSLAIPNNLYFAGEKVPIDKYWVKESLDRELLVNTYWQSQTILFIKRCNRYFPIIEPILKENNIPNDFKYLAVIESGLMPRAISPARAAGIWQFTRTTAREYGLEVRSDVDERYNIKRATQTACAYFNKMYSYFHNWTIVAATYNAGRTGIRKQLERQKANSYYNLLLGSETGRYVYRIIAIKEILTHANFYGFHVKKEHLYNTVPSYNVNVDSTITNIATFAKHFNLSYKEFKDLNPWLRTNTLSNQNKKKYTIRLPKSSKLNQNSKSTI